MPSLKFFAAGSLMLAWSCRPMTTPLNTQSEVASLQSKTGQILGVQTKNGRTESVCIHKFVHPNYEISTPQGSECGLNRRVAPPSEIDYETHAFEPWLKEIGPQSMIKRNMRYATSQIFPKKIDNLEFKISFPLYGKPRCFLQPRALEALNLASANLVRRDPSLRLMVLDCYRPMYVSQIMWDKVKDPIWVGASGKSGHNIGGTVDLTLANLVEGQVKEINMGSPFDLFDKISNYIPNSLDVNSAAYRNRTLLRKVMTESGFAPYDSEWWHFSLDKSRLENKDHLDLPL